MKKDSKTAEKMTQTLSPALQKLAKTVDTRRTALDNAVLAYERKSDKYHNAFREGQPIEDMRNLRAAEKIAKFTMKIRKVEYKLASMHFKAAKKHLKQQQAEGAKSQADFVDSIKEAKKSEKAANLKKGKQKSDPVSV